MRVELDRFRFQERLLEGLGAQTRAQADAAFRVDDPMPGNVAPIR